MTTHKQIIDVKPGMLIRNEKKAHDYSPLIIDPSIEEGFIHVISVGDTEVLGWSLIPGDEVRWPNEPEDSWRKVFQQIGKRKVKVRTILYCLRAGEKPKAYSCSCNEPSFTADASKLFYPATEILSDTIDEIEIEEVKS